MKKKAMLVSQKQVQPKLPWLSLNAIQFPQALRNAIPGPELPDCDRLLVLSSIDGARANSYFYGHRVELKMRVEESGKLTGAFDVKVSLTIEAARALAQTLQKLIEHSGERT